MTIPTPDPKDLCTWVRYWKEHPDLWNTAGSARAFLTTRKQTLLDRGILFPTTQGWLVDKPKLDTCLLELLMTADGYPREEAAA